MRILKVVTIILLLNISFLYSQNELIQKGLLSQKQTQLINIEEKLSIAQQENSKAKNDLISLEKRQKDKQFDYENKKNAFERASKNVDLVSSEKINQLSNEFKLADNELREINIQFQEAQLKEQETLKKLEQALLEKNNIKQDILNLKADIFDIQLREPVWAIGESVCNLAENESPDQCRKRALESAQRDAMEKAGKMILESETIVKNYQLYLDEIRTHIKAQIMEQDSDPKYGIEREVVGDNIRYKANLRLKVQSLSEYNPFRKQIEVAFKNTKIDTASGNSPFFTNPEIQPENDKMVYWEKSIELKDQTVSMTYAGGTVTIAFPAGQISSWEKICRSGSKSFIIQVTDVQSKPINIPIFVSVEKLETGDLKLKVSRK